MKKITKIMLAAAIMIPFISVNAQSAKVKQEREAILAPFPAAKEGMVRHVIYVDKKSDESLFKVEIIPGKVMSVDNNRHILSGKIEEKNVEGWGYTYYEFTTNGQVASTLMASIGPKVDKFVSSRPIMVSYNSKMPVVVYAPEGYDIQHRIWKAGKSKTSPVM
ncbi:ecotin family protein [uncultured Alistipes sp.]|jgi:ecotin|uniref:ecotin family protein n=1 Tax=uncultured Alistipes sp. TaxID=538949 RepID=UPI0025FF3C56|nr:ecotin family protein [uncultured Alistipes sp.]